MPEISLLHQPKDHGGFEQIIVLSMPEDYCELPISNRCGPADELCVGTDPSNSEYSGAGDVDEPGNSDGGR
jgi:hypothetical protein